MRLLLMIGNSNMAIREMYSAVLRDKFPGWGISNMSGLPSSPATIIGGYNALIYELGAPDDPKRYQAILELWEEIKPLATASLITHIEGSYREGIVAELENRGIVVIGSPFSPQAIAAALQRLVPHVRPTENSGESKGGRLRALLGRQSQRGAR